MGSNLFRIIFIGVLFLFTIVSGVWLSNSGKPLNTLIFTIHKLIAFGAVILMVIVIRNLARNVDIKTLLFILIFAAGLFVLSLIITGVLLSLGKPVNHIILTIHRVMPILSALTIPTVIFLLVSRK